MRAAGEGRGVGRARNRRARRIPGSRPRGMSAESNERFATSAMVTLRSVPAMAKPPFSNTMSPAAASIMCAAIFLPRSTISSAASTIAEPASMAEREPNVPMRVGHEIGVAIAIADAVGVDAELLRQDLLERGAVALAVIHAAGDERDRRPRDRSEFRHARNRARRWRRPRWRRRRPGACRASSPRRGAAARPR